MREVKLSPAGDAAGSFSAAAAAEAAARDSVDFLSIAVAAEAAASESTGFRLILGNVAAAPVENLECGICRPYSG